MKYPIAEKFHSIQGEGLYTGTPMAFIRFVGCSVGKSICTHCDTDFEQMQKTRGGGSLSLDQLLEWVGSYRHICLTGGEPLDRDLDEFLSLSPKYTIHVETSGTVLPRNIYPNWLTVSPKPGYLEHMIAVADEIKVIYGGLGDGPGWPLLEDAIKWAGRGKLVYLQPRNEKHTIDSHALDEVIELCEQYPNLRVSAQMHKFFQVR